MNLLKLTNELNGCEREISNIKYICITHKVLQKWFSPYSNPFAKFEKKAFGKYGEAKVEFGVIAYMFDYV